jgi:flagellar protein FliO/FliZ
MFDTLFGAEMPLAVRFFLAFLIVLGLIGATAWAVRRFGTGRLGSNTRGRQPRLAVVDYASVDGRRRLILVRRDNVEHLMMIGGPTDVVVEPNIVRATPAARDLPGARPAAGIDALPRAIPLPENGNGSAWPLAPESTVGLRASPRPDSLPDELPARSFPAVPETPARPQRDTLSALADELSTRPIPAPAPAPTLPRRETRAELRRPIVPPAPPPAESPALTATAEAPTAADQSLADMAQRLEAALRKPNETAPAAAPSRATAATESTLPPPPPRPSRPEARPAPRTDARPSQGKGDKTALYDSLEQEMASLLGRPNKT